MLVLQEGVRSQVRCGELGRGWGAAAASERRRMRGRQASRELTTLLAPRRDILRRHELAHVKADKTGDAAPKTSANQRSKPKRAAPEPAVSQALPAKVMRISRACNRCSKSK